jgi:hypothetical protein
MCNFGLNSKRESEKDKYFNWIKEKYPTEQKHLNKLNL